MAVKTITVKSFDDFTKVIENDNTADLVLFRGQSVDKPPLPKLGRLKLDRGIKDAEKSLLSQFRLLSRSILTVRPEDDWEWLALAQHHGLPTRLLDWTPNPLVALWFAVEQPATKGASGVVWVYKPDVADMRGADDTSPYTCPTVKVFRPANVTDRIRAQAGFFTVHRINAAGKLVAAHEDVPEDRFLKLVIPCGSFPVFRYRLDQYGTNSYSLFPDLDGLTAHLLWLHVYYGDEPGKLKRAKDLKAWRL